MKIENRIGKYMASGRSWYTRNMNTVKKITVHHTASTANSNDDEKMLRTHANYHISRGWAGLSYHYIIAKSGRIYNINSNNWVTWHDSHNWDSLSICLDGYFHPDRNEKPTEKQLKSMAYLLNVLCTQHPEFPAGYDDIVWHGERSATACCGNNLIPYVREFREKKGDVDWGDRSTESPTNGDCWDTLPLNVDIPSRFENRLKLKEYDFYNKNWTMTEMVENHEKLYKKKKSGWKIWQ